MNFSLASLYNWYRGLIRNPQTRMWVILGTIVYFFSPIDLAPDLFPFLGQFDDILLITILLSELLQLPFINNAQDVWNQVNKAANPSQAVDHNGNEDDQTHTVDVKAVSIDE